jgi:predicted membrane protein
VNDGAKATSLFFFVLILMSIAFNFWIWLVVAAFCILGIILVYKVLTAQERRAVRRVRSRSFNPVWNFDRRKSAMERSLRSRIAEEWDRQESEDLEDWK